MAVFDDMTAFGVVPVLTIEDVRNSLPLADALLALHSGLLVPVIV
ncbi:hypothetical protein OAB79_02235 [Yoonia sp.]|nr:hypothetical protein [Yoonia sp.]